MNYKALALAAVVVSALVLVFSVARAQAPSNESPQLEPRFQIVTATVDGIPGRDGQVPENHTIFLLERTTGRVWRYRSGFFAYRKDGSVTGPAMDSDFESINIDGFRGYDSKQAIKEWMQQQKP
jgi:hypothetical protein